MFVGPNVTDFPTWNVTVNDTNPLWFYCKQHNPDGSSHCGHGMVFAVNPVQSSPRNFSAFQQLAQTLNGTNTTTTTSSSGSSAPSATTTGTNNNGASSVAVNLALGLASVLAIFATAL